MVGVAQLVEPRIVIPVVVGSSPIVHPTLQEGCRELDSPLQRGVSSAAEQVALNHSVRGSNP